MTTQLSHLKSNIFETNSLAKRWSLRLRTRTLLVRIPLQWPHSAVRFHYNTSYTKYLLNCKQRLKTRKKMTRKNYLFKKIFNIKFLPYSNTTSMLLVRSGSQVASVHWYFVFRCWAMIFSQSPKVKLWTIPRFFYILK